MEIAQLKPNSHKIITCKCEFNASPYCSIKRVGEYRDFRAIKEKNQGKYICLPCSRFTKASGRKNPNSKYKIDDSMFRVVDSEEKAYLLGLIASDGSLNHNGAVTIKLHNKDIDILVKIKKIFNIDIPIFKSKDMRGICISSKKIMKDIAFLLGVDVNQKSLKKDKIVKMPKFDNLFFQWAFIRGYFDGDGSISIPNEVRRTPQISIASYSNNIRNSIKEFCQIPCDDTGTALWWYSSNALDFLAKIYGGNPSLFLDRKMDLYKIWSSWTPSLWNGKGIRGNIDGLKWAKTCENAVPPSKVRASDSGYDLTIIGVDKVVGEVVFYKTGIKVNPPFGYYFDLVARSSLAKTGYMLANGIGIIDRSYVGEIIIPLVKINKNFPDLPVPSRIVQLVPRNIVHFELIEVKNFEDTSRADKRFGSSGIK